MQQRKLVDAFGREHNYLRISITDRCNLRCFYCMGPDGVPWLDRKQILNYEEILEVVKVAADLGVNRIRLTGGEPLVRKNLNWLIQKIREIPQITDLSLTTNAILLAEQALELREAGLDRVNISMDTLDPAVYSQITRGGDLSRVWAGIEAALKAGLNPVKLNIVLLKKVNEAEIPNLLRLAYERPLHIRFIEYMPLGYLGINHPEHYLSLQVIRETAAALDMDLKPTDSLKENGAAETYALSGGKGTVGLIHPLSRPFCATCNRLRLTADGVLKPCLYWKRELPVRPVLGQPEKIRELFLAAMKLKPEKHEMRVDGHLETNRRCMSRIGG